MKVFLRSTLPGLHMELLSSYPLPVSPLYAVPPCWLAYGVIIPMARGHGIQYQGMAFVCSDTMHMLLAGSLDPSHWPTTQLQPWLVFWPRSVVCGFNCSTMVHPWTGSGHGTVLLAGSLAWSVLANSPALGLGLHAPPLVLWFISLPSSLWLWSWLLSLTISLACLWIYFCLVRCYCCYIQISLACGTLGRALGSS